jgi:hypothetical protein
MVVDIFLETNIKGKRNILSLTLIDLAYTRRWEVSNE